MKNPRLIGYWIATVLIALPLIGSGSANLMRVENVATSIDSLGYPAYLMTILGTWKILGALAILAPKTPRLKEWAHAGVTFSMTGAALSHLLNGDPVAQAIAPIVFVVLNLTSWWLRPASRKLAAS